MNNYTANMHPGRGPRVMKININAIRRNTIANRINLGASLIIIVISSLLLFKSTGSISLENSVRLTRRSMAEPEYAKQPPKDPTYKAPVIAVITQVFRDYRKYFDHRSLHLPSSYVKWIESSGGKVLPVLLNETDDYYEQVFASSQGLLLPGGDNLLDPKRNTPMLEAARKLYKLALESNDRGEFYPIWGTCLGMELLTVLSSNKNTLENCQANDLVLNLTLVKPGRLFAAHSAREVDYADYIVDLLRNSNVTYHYHHKCVTDWTLRSAKLDRFYEPLAYSFDQNGFKFVSIFEARQYPFYGVQFHPEKPAFEHENHLEKQDLIPHSPEAIATSRYFADFFMSQARQARQPKQPVSLDQLIYNYCPVYLAPKGDMYEQRYIWPFVSGEHDKDMGEFVDRPLADDETVDEDLIQDTSC